MQENLTFQNIILRYLNDPHNEALTLEVNTFRALSAENEKYFQELKDIWDRSSETILLQEIDVALSVKKFRSRLNSRSASGPRANFSNWLRGAAAVLILSIAGFWMYSSQHSIEYLVKQTEGKTDSVVLSDGTKVMLAAHSSVKFPSQFKGEIRQISLLKGEAFFEVHKDPKHPFHVEIGHSKVSVLGTSFNIKYSNTNIDLSVKTGRVMFTPNAVSKPSILTAGQAISYNLKGNTIQKLDGTNANAWLTKELHFVDMPLKEVCEQVADYYHVKIELLDEKHTAKKFNANFKSSSLEEVLTVLKETYKIQISKSEGLITIKTI